MNIDSTPHGVLPVFDRELLKLAAQTRGAHAREEAIDAAIDIARRRNPKLFQPVESKEAV